MSERIEKIRDAVAVMHQCAATHLESAPIVEIFRGQVVWDGVVEVFALTGHPKAKRAYAWSFKDDKGETQFTAVLEIPPVTSPVTAVRTAIVANAKK